MICLFNKVYRNLLVSLLFCVTALLFSFKAVGQETPPTEGTDMKSTIGKMMEEKTAQWNKDPNYPAPVTGYYVTFKNNLFAIWEDLEYREDCKFRYRGTCKHYADSITKSVMSSLLGIAIEKNVNGILGKIGETNSKFKTAIGLNLLQLATDGSHPEELKKHAQLEKITLHQLLTMTAGFYWREAEHSKYWTYNTFPVQDMILGKKIKRAFNPNDVLPPKVRVFLEMLQAKRISANNFEYSTASSDMAALAMIGKLKCGYGKLDDQLQYSLYSIARRFLFKDIKVASGIHWEKDEMCGHDAMTYMGGSGLFMNLYAMGQFGNLILKQGKYRDKQTIAKEWVKLAIPIPEEWKREPLPLPRAWRVSSNRDLVYPKAGDVTKWVKNAMIGSPIETKADDQYGYGYQWWIVKLTEYQTASTGETFIYFTAIGADGQFIAIAPKYELVVVMTHATAESLMEYAALSKFKKGEKRKNIKAFHILPYFNNLMMELMKKIGEMENIEEFEEPEEKDSDKTIEEFEESGMKVF